MDLQDQEIKRLKQELLTLSKRETATRSAHKLETPLPAAAKMADDSLPHNCLLPYTTHDTITSLPSGVFTSSNGAPTLPPRSERPAVLSSSKCIDKHEQLFNATKLLQPEPICRVDYSALVAVMFPICQRIHGTLSAILIDCKTSTDCSLSNSKSSRSDLECNSCKMSTNQVASALVSTSANLPQQTASSRRSDIGRACPLYDTPLSAVSSMQPPSESSKHQTDAHGLSSFGQHDSKILSEISVLAIATIDDLVTAVSTSVLCTTKLIQCIRSISVVLCEAVIPLWHQLIEKCMNNKIWKDNAEIAKFCNSLHALENLLEDGLSLIETCASTFEAVIWSDYDQAFCNYCVAYQKYNASCGRLMINETDVVYTEDLGSRTKSGGNSHVRIVTPSSTHNFGGSDNLNERKNENKRPMSKPSSPLAKKLFRSDSTSPASTRGINFDAPTHSSVDGAMDWELFDENEAKTSISLVLTNNLESAEQISRLVKNISYRMLLVDPSRLMFYNQPTSSDNLLDKPIDRKMLHRSAQETIRLTNRLKCVTKHINSRFVGLSEPNEFNTSSNNSTTDLSSDIISTIRRVVAFVQMHRRFLATKPQLAVVLQNKSKKSFGVHIENRVAKVIQSICDGSHHALMTNSSAANLFSAVSLNDDWVKKGYGPCNTSLNRTKPAGRSIIVNTGIYIANGSKGDLKGSWAPKHASIEYLEVFNVLSLLAGKSLNWDNQRILLSSLTAVLLQYEGAFEALTQMHCQIQGYDTNLSNFKSIYVTGLATGKDTFAHATLGLSSENRDELYPVRESVGIINDIGVMSSVKCPTVTEGRSVSLITILLRYFISIDMKDNQSFDSNVRNTGDDFGCSNDNPAFFQLMIIDLLVQLLSKYKSRAVPIVLGIDLTSVVNSRPVQSAYSMQPTSTPGKSAVFGIFKKRLIVHRY